MAVVEMGKLNLVAMMYDKDAVLNALQRTGATEIKLHGETEFSVPLHGGDETLRAYYLRAEQALGVLTEKLEKFYKKTGVGTDALAAVEVSYSEFMSAKNKKDSADAIIGRVEELVRREKECETELVKVRRTLSAASVYADVDAPLSVENSAHTRVRFGTVPSANGDKFVNALKALPLSAYSLVASDGENSLFYIASHKSQAEEAEAVLQEYGFSGCPFGDGRTGRQLYADLKQREQQLIENIDKAYGEWAGFAKDVRELKIYCDYLAFGVEKSELSEKLRATQTTFLLEAYVPVSSQELVSGELNALSTALYYEFSSPSADEVPPTLLKNNKVVENFEAITNMYSPPSSREFDPNTVMAFFYSVFLGFIMADIGYGLLMILGGGFILLKSKDRQSMICRLGGVFAVGGIFTIIWGVLFNSFFGFALLPFKVMPDLRGTEMSWSLAGINVPALLIISMLIGVIQLFAGYVCRAVQCWRRGQITDGIFDGLVWALFSIGVEFAIVGFVDEFNVSVLAMVGGIIAGASLLVAVLTAGRKEKLLGKFTKGFGSAYGVINYASDILSYARLYGLMLAGAVIADIISSNSVNLISSGNAGFIIMGILIMLIGHIFNLAIGLLGAYIHDARLQYVEFYGRFYEGEGVLFSPLGSAHKHVRVIGK